MTALLERRAPARALPHGLAAEVLGDGGPVTLLVHGLGGSTAETRPLARDLAGTRVLLEWRGHGQSAALPPDGWDYDLLADDLLAAADAVGATRAVGVSLGAGALLRVLAERPSRFERVALVLPAVLDAERTDAAAERLARLGDAVDRQDADAVQALLLAEVPGPLQGERAVRVLLRRRAVQLVRRPAPRPARTGADRPVTDRSVLASARVPALVVGQEADPLHPLELAAAVADALPGGRLLALPPGGVPWSAGRLVSAALAAHLTPTPDPRGST